MYRVHRLNGLKAKTSWCRWQADKYPCGARTSAVLCHSRLSLTSQFPRSRRLADVTSFICHFRSRGRVLEWSEIIVSFHALAAKCRSLLAQANCMAGNFTTRRRRDRDVTAGCCQPLQPPQPLLCSSMRLTPSSFIARRETRRDV